MSVFIKIADVLDRIADEQDRLEEELATKTASAQSSPVIKSKEGPTDLDKFALFYKEKTGEDLPEEVKTKLSVEPIMSEIVSKLGAQSSTERTPLGEAEDIKTAGTGPETSNRNDRKNAAWERFGEFLTSQHP